MESGRILRNALIGSLSPVSRLIILRQLHTVFFSSVLARPATDHSAHTHYYPFSLSMRLGIWSKWVGKQRKLRNARKIAACPNSLDEEGKITRKESADGLDSEEYPVPCADRSPISRPCYRRHHATATVYPCSRQAASKQARVEIWTATLAPSQAGANSNPICHCLRIAIPQPFPTSKIAFFNVAT